jgi:hypothetical protein
LNNNNITPKKRKSEIIIPTIERLENIPESKCDYTDDGLLVRVSKTVLERYSSPRFDIDKILTEFSESLFELDKLEAKILGIIAEHGALNENILSSKMFKINADYTRDKIRYKLNHPKNSKTLLRLGFITQESGNKIGNIKNKYEKIYRLTFKGLMASLSTKKFENNYLVKNFKSFITKWADQYNVPEFSIIFMKYHLALFMLKNILDGSILTGLKNIESNFFTMNEGAPLLGSSFPQKITDKELNEKTTDIRVGFHLYSQVLRFSISEIVRQGQKKARHHGHKDFSIIEFPSEVNYAMNILPNFIKNWYDSIERLQYENIEKFNPYTLPYDQENEMYDETGLIIDSFSVNILAKRILKKHGIHPNFPLNEGTEFIL